MESELTSEKQRREEVNIALRQATTDQAGDWAKLQALESAVAAQGGDPREILSRAEAAAAEQVGLHSSAEVEELRRLLKASKEQCDQLQSSLTCSREGNAETTTRLQAQLDGARTELQGSLQRASEAHTSQVAQFEQEIQAERQRGVEEALSERMCMERMVQLKEQKGNIYAERVSVAGQVQ